ncbi:hypothetical protein ACR788_23745 [Sphingobacterium siyangense]|uniref:hypothetical protein n=1 Tax=Sphingobacterium siyangense TaxID=459529 RepID=UPI003DA4CFF1
MNNKVQEMKSWKDEEILEFIRKRLTISLDSEEFARHGIFSQEEIKLRFDMSGYEGTTGSVTVGNQAILNRFANLGIYDYTKYLFLDFYKGSGTVYWQYWSFFPTDEPNEHEDLSGYTTSEIILFIFKKTILSDRKTRRRI